MAWYTGKTAIPAALIGDSNAEGSGGFTPPGGQTIDPYLYCYASSAGQTPYSEANLGWRSGLDPNGTARMDEYSSYIATVGNIGFIGQLLGGNGNPGMQAGSTVRAGTGIPNYLYKCCAGGTTSDFWANGDGWDTLVRTIPAALASIPGAPTAFDYITFSLGGNDAIGGVTAEQFYTNFKTLRAKMIAAGWWVPNTTQIVILDMPRSGYFADNFGDWQGVDVPSVVPKFWCCPYRAKMTSMEPCVSMGTLVSVNNARLVAIPEHHVGVHGVLCLTFRP